MSITVVSVNIVYTSSSNPIFTFGFFNDNSTKSLGKSFNLFGNSSSERFRNTISGFTVLSKTDYMTFTQLPMRLDQDVIVTTTF